MQIVCTTANAAARVLLLLLGDGLHPVRDFTIQPIFSITPPITYTMVAVLNATQATKIGAVADTAITEGTQCGDEPPAARFQAGEYIILIHAYHDVPVGSVGVITAVEETTPPRYRVHFGDSIPSGLIPENRLAQLKQADRSTAI
jgi:hypothetical protein